jgi:hypothetical protein
MGSVKGDGMPQLAERLPSQSDMPEKQATQELDDIAARIRERTFGDRIRDYVNTGVHGYSRVVIADVGVKEK